MDLRKHICPHQIRHPTIVQASVNWQFDLAEAEVCLEKYQQSLKPLVLRRSGIGKLSIGGKSITSGEVTPLPYSILQMHCP